MRPGQTLLVNGASGGVGTFAVQVGRLMDAAVTGVCSADNLDYVQALGAQNAIDYRQEDFTRSKQLFDVVFDAAAKSSYRQSRRVLRSPGMYITTVPSANSLLWQVATSLTRRRCRHVLVRPRGDDIQLIAKLLEEGDLRPVVQDVFPLAAADQAHRLSQEGHMRGKLVLSTSAEE
jgi:NADPH:quinone reductase-like Zn-dependent oxidoreductase